MMNETQSMSGAAKAQETSRAAPAPVIFVAVLLVGVLLSLAFPVSFLPRIVTLLVGAACFLIPFALGFAALGFMRRARTSVNPYRPTTALLTGGPYRLSRNPMYLAMAIQYVGLALLFDSLWAIVLLPLALVVVHFTVIQREERYLERKFGEEYLSYKATVRRWL
ncbi:MAG TPA: isoprenylcysteine carboxylmethyltransferase family protein [Ktedonobacterales bacterium]|jgi:protein-S-isoprenylcysteine O-methyltransferase Ste14